jgi:hypothetical protein
MYENCIENQKFVWQLSKKIFYQNSEYLIAHQNGSKARLSEAEILRFQLLRGRPLFLAVLSF